MAETVAKLYTPTLLALSVELANFPLDESMPLLGRAKSRTCGSEVILSASPNVQGAIARIGMQVTACAVGQAAAAIFAATCEGRDTAAIGSDLHEIGNWLKGDAPSSILPRLDLLQPARDYPGRHEAILLPWRAALNALSSSDSSG